MRQCIIASRVKRIVMQILLHKQKGGYYYRKVNMQNEHVKYVIAIANNNGEKFI